MEVFNKFYSSVSSTVSHLSGVLPGNPVTREFEATELIASAGPGLLWKVYKGYKKSTKQEASIFVFEKKQLERWPKLDREPILETLKRGIIQLTKLRHPQILTVQYSLEESRESLAFATEPIFASLANIIYSDTVPQPTPKHLKNHNLYEVEIKYGLMQIAEGLSFLHNDVKLLHRNICPESIVVNQQGAWKIFGFDLCIANLNGAGLPPVWPFTEYCSTIHPLTQPPLDYLAPEYVLTASHSPASDIYSLGMLIYVLHSPNHQTVGNIGCDYTKFTRFANELRALPAYHMLCVAEGLREYVKLMLNATPELRPDTHQFLKIQYFEDVGVKTLNYLDSLFQWDNLQKSQFYKGLPQVIQTMPHRICMHRILPCLVKEFVNPPMVPFVLPNVLLIAENSTKEEYIKYILPVLKPVMLILDPIQILLIFMQKMELLLKLTPAEEIKSDILPMLYRALESDTQQIQELCLSILPTFASLIDYPAMKNAVLPRIKKLCLTTNLISLRVNCLLCIGKLLDNLDKWLVLDGILPFLPQIPSREPAVLMGILGIYKIALNHNKLGITKEVLATKVLPFLIPLCVENGLTVTQYNALITLVKQMIDAVEKEHKAKLQQLNSIQNESKGIEHTLTSADTLIPAPMPKSSSHADDLFSGLGLEGFTFNEPTKTDDKYKSEVVTELRDGNKTLSIEDKQRIAKQQESKTKPSHRARHSFHSTQQNSHERPTPTMATSKTVDLTSTLMESNLNQLTKFPYSASTASTISSPGMITYASTPAMTNMHHGPSPATTNLSQQLPPNLAYKLKTQEKARNSGYEATLVASLTANWIDDGSNASNFNSKWTNSRTNPQASTDWSQFESLLPNQSKDKPIQSPTKKKALNEHDMMDLLS